MESQENQFVHCETFEKNIIIDGVQISMSVDSINKSEIELYFPFLTLVYITQGNLHIREGDESHVYEKGSYLLVRKFTLINFTKSWSSDVNSFKCILFFFQDEYIRKAINSFSSDDEAEPSFTTKSIKLAGNSILSGFVRSIEEYFKNIDDFDKEFFQLKTTEGMLGVLKSDPSLVQIFSQLSTPFKINLAYFMEYHYKFNLPLPKLAVMSGRSLSSFNRDFRRKFKDSPHQWIKKRRLELAKSILLETDRTASEFYMEIGFEDLGHFSKSFKKYFGVNPSEINSQDSAYSK